MTELGEHQKELLMRTWEEEESLSRQQWISLLENFRGAPKLIFLSFEPNFPKKDISGGKHKKWTSPLNFLHIQISQVSNFSLNWQFWFFGSNLRKKVISGLKRKKVNITTEFNIFELVWVLNFILNKQFWILGTNLPK